MLWMRVWSPEGVVTGCSTAMADGLLPLLVTVVEDLGDVVPALFHAHQAEAQVGDHVPYDVVGFLAPCRQQQDVARAGQAAVGVEDVDPARVERLTDRAGAVRV